jgi:hypothetical protein
MFACSCRRWLARSALVLSWTILAMVQASAQEISPGASDRVSLDVEACPTVPAEAVRHILGIEIGDLLLGESQSRPAASHRLTIRCAGNTAWVEAAGEGGADPVDRTLRLDAFPGDAAPRVLALAGLELLAARSPAVRARMQAKPEPAVPLLPTRPLEVIHQPRGSLHVGLAGIWRSFFIGQGVSAWGGQAQLGWLLDRWHLSADLEVGGARRDVKLGETSAVLLSGGAAFGLVGGVGSRVFTLALGGRLGMARLGGNPADTTKVSSSAVVRPWGGPMVSLGFIGRFRPLALILTAEAGRSLFTAEGQAESTTVLAVGGTWVAISLGGALMP